MFQGMEYVYEVYREKSFSKAAANLFISQPSLSATVKRIEKKVGYPIFDRSTKPLRLTEYGVHYIRAVERIMAAESEFTTYLNDIGELKTGTLRIGGTNFFSSWILPPLIADFTQAYPQVQVSLTEETTANLTQLLQNGMLDMVLDNSLLDEQIFDQEVCLEEHLFVAVPSALPVNERLKKYQVTVEDIRSKRFLSPDIPCIHLQELQDLPFIMMKQENDTGKRARLICQEQQFTPNVAFELDQQMTAYNVACSKLGVAFLGDLLITRVPPNSSLCYYKLRGTASVRNVSFYWKKGRYLSRAMEEFLRRYV